MPLLMLHDGTRIDVVGRVVVRVDDEVDVLDVVAVDVNVDVDVDVEDVDVD